MHIYCTQQKFQTYIKKSPFMCSISHASDNNQAEQIETKIEVQFME
jgi:hypothetical protein